MKKIMFNDKYGLTQAVLEGRKTNTRRIIPVNLYNAIDWKAFEEGKYDCIIDPANPYKTDIRDYAQYKIGEEVAIAQNYHDAHLEWLYKNKMERAAELVYLHKEKGWSNKMFVKASLMPHRIKITNIRVERLQDISDEDCMKEGVVEFEDLFGHGFMIDDPYNNRWRRHIYTTARLAFASLIDKVSGKGTWDSNPYVFVYDFELLQKQNDYGK